MHSSRISVTATSIAQEIIKYFVNQASAEAAFTFLLEALPEIKQQFIPISKWERILQTVAGDPQKVLALNNCIELLHAHHNKEMWTEPEDNVRVVQILFLFFKQNILDANNLDVNTAIIWAVLQKMVKTNHLSLVVNEELCKKILTEKEGKVFIDALEVEVKIVVAQSKQLARSNALGDLGSEKISDPDNDSGEHTVFDDDDCSDSDSSFGPDAGKKNRPMGSLWQLFGLPLIFGDVSDVVVHQSAGTKSTLSEDGESDNPGSDAKGNAAHQRARLSH